MTYYRNHLIWRIRKENFYRS